MWCWPWCGRFVPRPVVCGPAGLVGVVPAPFEVLEELGFDLRGDVAVDLGQPVGQMVPKAPCLSDLRNVVGDQSGLVTVSEAVEGEAGSDRVCAFAEVAVNGGSEHPAVEGAAS